MNASRKILIQGAAIVGAGAAIGLADSLIRPVMIERPPPPPVETATRPKPETAPSQPPPAGEQISADLVAKGHITIAQAVGLYKEQAYFIDARRKEEYEAGHVAGAFRVTLAAFSGKTPPLIDALPRDAKIVTYCIGGNCDESEAVAKQMNLMGFTTVYVMHAGFPGWQAGGNPVETGAGVQEEGH